MRSLLPSEPQARHAAPRAWHRSAPSSAPFPRRPRRSLRPATACLPDPPPLTAGTSAARRGASARALADASLGAPAEAAATQYTGRIGVLLLNLGGPESLDDVQPFLYNLFADPDIIRLPAELSFLQKPLASLVSTLRASKSKEGYAAIGGGSPLRRITEEQAEALRGALEEKGCNAHVYVAMRYWRPFTEEAVAQIKADGITRLVVLPLYPQFSISTSGSSLRLLEALFRDDPYLASMAHTVIPSWYQRPGYVRAMADLIQAELGTAFPGREATATIFFSAHGVPQSYVSDAGDPYKEEMEECVALVMGELRARGVPNPFTLAYQSRVGPVEWLKPYTDATIRELGAAGTPALLAVPVSFVSEHIETLEEIDCEYRELAHEAGIAGWGRVPALGVHGGFIDDLAEAVLEALPHTDTMAAPAAAADPTSRALVPLGSVEDLLATYDGERLRLPPPVVVWRWGWTRSAEVWNGRAAMLAVLSLLLLEASTGTGVLHSLRLLFAGETRRGGLAGLLAGPALGVLVGYGLALFLRSETKPAARGKKSGAKRVAASWGDVPPPPGAELKLMLVVRDDLGMSTGKVAAQCAHAAVGLVDKLRGKRDALLAAWEECGQTKICVKADGMDAFVKLAKAAEAAGLPVFVVQDAGRTEVEPGTHTVMAIGPGEAAAVNSVTGQLRLLK